MPFSIVPILFSTPINFAGVTVNELKASDFDSPLLTANFRFLRNSVLFFIPDDVMAKVMLFSCRILGLNGAVSHFFKSLKLMLSASSKLETS